jgi:hypothetical protein
VIHIIQNIILLIFKLDSALKTKAAFSPTENKSSDKLPPNKEASRVDFKTEDFKINTVR